MTDPARTVEQRVEQLEQLVHELARRDASRRRPRKRMRVERHRAALVELHPPSELDRAAARKALSRYR